jgi:hypothetical protein
LFSSFTFGSTPFSNLGSGSSTVIFPPTDYITPPSRYRSLILNQSTIRTFTNTINNLQHEEDLKWERNSELLP